MPLADALGLEPDVVFDVAVEANRPDAWSMAGWPATSPPAWTCRSPFPNRRPRGRVRWGGAGSIADLATVQVDDLELCPRFTARVITGVGVGPSPCGWPAA